MLHSTFCFHTQMNNALLSNEMNIVTKLDVELYMHKIIQI